MSMTNEEYEKKYNRMMEEYEKKYNCMIKSLKDDIEKLKTVDKELGILISGKRDEL